MGGSNGMFDPGNVHVAAPYFISGRTGTLTGLVAGDAVARLLQLGMVDPRDPSAPLVPTPIRISQIRLKYLPLTVPPTLAVAFEVFKGTAASQADTGGNARAAQRRKTSGGYPLISTAETSLYVGATGAITGGGVFTPLVASAPVDMMVSAGSVPGVSVWTPADLCGITLEVGEALEVRAAAFGETGILLVAFDFLR